MTWRRCLECAVLSVVLSMPSLTLLSAGLRPSQPLVGWTHTCDPLRGRLFTVLSSNVSALHWEARTFRLQLVPKKKATMRFYYLPENNFLSPPYDSLLFCLTSLGASGCVARAQPPLLWNSDVTGACFNFESCIFFPHPVVYNFCDHLFTWCFCRINVLFRQKLYGPDRKIQGP